MPLIRECWWSTVRSLYSKILAPWGNNSHKALGCHQLLIHGRRSGQHLETRGFHLQVTYGYGWYGVSAPNKTRAPIQIPPCLPGNRSELAPKLIQPKAIKHAGWNFLNPRCPPAHVVSQPTPDPHVRLTARLPVDI